MLVTMTYDQPTGTKPMTTKHIWILEDGIWTPHMSFDNDSDLNYELEMLELEDIKSKIGEKFPINEHDFFKWFEDFDLGSLEKVRDDVLTYSGNNASDTDYQQDDQDISTHYWQMVKATVEMYADAYDISDFPFNQHNQ
tara:strand:+ start:383 stop:799 length:417 start_codon:yes stop_codon:yes gene_type:complete